MNIGKVTFDDVLQAIRVDEDETDATTRAHCHWISPTLCDRI